MEKAEDIFHVWRNESLVDFTDQSMPSEFTREEKASGRIWKILASAFVAGLANRCVVAPLERIKIISQVKMANLKYIFF